MHPNPASHPVDEAREGGEAPDFDTADFEPDPARSYERAKPFKETGDDRLDCQNCPPSARPDRMIRAVHNAHESHQLNSDSAIDAGAAQRID